MLEQDQFKHRLSQLLQGFGVAVYDHAVDRRSAARRRVTAHSLDFDDAHPAGSEWLEIGVGAQAGDGNIVAHCTTENRFFLMCLERAAVDRDLHGCISLSLPFFARISSY
jgi:hypothetical protein